MNSSMYACPIPATVAIHPPARHPLVAPYTTDGTDQETGTALVATSLAPSVYSVPASMLTLELGTAEPEGQEALQEPPSPPVHTDTAPE